MEDSSEGGEVFGSSVGTSSSEVTVMTVVLTSGGPPLSEVIVTVLVLTLGGGRVLVSSGGAVLDSSGGSEVDSSGGTLSLEVMVMILVLTSGGTPSPEVMVSVLVITLGVRDVSVFSGGMKVLEVCFEVLIIGPGGLILVL